MSESVKKTEAFFRHLWCVGIRKKCLSCGIFSLISDSNEHVDSVASSRLCSGNRKKSRNSLVLRFSLSIKVVNGCLDAICCPKMSLSLLTYNRVELNSISNPLRSNVGEDLTVRGMSCKVANSKGSPNQVGRQFCDCYPKEGAFW